MGLVNVENVKIESSLDKENVKKNEFEGEKKSINIEKIKNLKKDVKKNYADLLHNLNKLYKLQPNKHIGDALITIESIKNKLN